MKLPGDILSYIFNLGAQDYGSVLLPFEARDPPSQLIASHVCSKWRQVALETHELWNDVTVRHPLRNSVPRQCLFNAWLSRAGSRHISLSFRCFDVANELSDLFLFNIIRSLRIKKLGLKLNMKEIFLLSAVEDMFPELDELYLVIYAIKPRFSHTTLAIPAKLIGKTRSITISNYYTEAGVLEHLTQLIPFPWSQLRCLDFGDICKPRCLSRWITILRQTHLLEECYLTVHKDDIAENQRLIFPHLRKLYLVIHDEIFSIHEADMVIRHFTLPSLTALVFHRVDFRGHKDWRNGVYMTMKQQCHLHGLEDVNFIGYHEPLSTLLKDAPLLRSLCLPKPNAVIDDEAMTGISTGALGRFLRKLSLRCNSSDVGKVLTMLEDRQRRVEMQVESGCRHEEFTAIRDVILRVENPRLEVDSRKVRVSALREKGIMVKWCMAS